MDTEKLVGGGERLALNRATCSKLTDENYPHANRVVEPISNELAMTAS